MKRGYVLLFLCGILITGASGCDQVGKVSRNLQRKEPPREPLVDMMDDVNLAKIILRPTYEKLVVEKDPFKPLITKEAPPEAIEDELLTGQMDGLQFVGVVKIDNEYAALVVTESKKGVYRIGDIVMGMEVVDIQPKALQLISQNSQKKFTLKRGEK